MHYFTKSLILFTSWLIFVSCSNLRETLPPSQIYQIIFPTLGYVDYGKNITYDFQTQVLTYYSLQKQQYQTWTNTSFFLKEIQNDKFKQSFEDAYRGKNELTAHQLNYNKLY